MPRAARNLVAGSVCNILKRGNGRQRAFHKDADYYAFLTRLKQMQEHYAIDLYAYCLMLNHSQLLVKPHCGEYLSLGMRWFTTTHVRRYHRHYRTSDHLGRYGTRALPYKMMITC